MELKKKITKQGIRQDWIAKKLGISPSYLSHILAKRRKLNRNKNLKNQIIELINGENNGNSSN